MRVFETTAHIGDDGMLRLEVPLEQRNQDVRVAVVVESAQPAAAGGATAAVPIWEQFQAILEGVTPEDVVNLPADGAANHDRYIYGNRRVSG